MLAITLVALVVLAVPSNAQTPDGEDFPLAGGEWVPITAPFPPIDAHAAARLNDGRVFIAGETLRILFDPSSEEFTEESSLARHTNVTATRLQDGRVLFFGSPPIPANGGFTSGTEAEVFDPESGEVYRVGDLAYPRSGHTATLLRDGRVVVLGGVDASTGENIAAVEIFDPESNAFAIAGNMLTPRAAHTATLLEDGRILVTGGNATTEPWQGITLDSAEVFDPVTGSASPTGGMVGQRFGHTATPLANGTVLIAGGWTRDAEIYDPDRGVFRLIGPLTTQRLAHSATRLRDGRVLLVGGANDVEQTTATAEIFDPVGETFRPVAETTAPRQQHSATLLEDGRVLITGGFDFARGGDVPSAEIFDPGVGASLVPPSPPHEFFGIARIRGAAAPAGAMVEALSANGALVGLARLGSGRRTTAFAIEPGDVIFVDTEEPIELTTTEGSLVVGAGYTEWAGPSMSVEAFADSAARIVWGWTGGAWVGYNPGLTAEDTWVMHLPRSEAQRVAFRVGGVACAGEEEVAIGAVTALQLDCPYAAQLIRLESGFHLVSWFGEPIAIEDFVADLRVTVDAVFVWDADTQTFRSYRPAFPMLSDLDLIPPGAAVWVAVGTGQGADWPQPTPLGAQSIDLTRGFNLVAWAGPEQAVDVAVAPLGTAFAALFVWDGQQYLTYRRDAPSFLNTASTLASGQAVWLLMNEAVGWDQPAP